MKHHPASVDLELVKRLVASTTTSNLQSFLYKEFSCISKEYAGWNLKGCGLSLMRPHSETFDCLNFELTATEQGTICTVLWMLQNKQNILRGIFLIYMPTKE